MRPRFIQDVLGLNPNVASPFDRLERFAQMIIRIPKAEADKGKEIEEKTRQSKRRKS
jgi:hypothetical protein